MAAVYVKKRRLSTRNFERFFKLFTNNYQDLLILLCFFKTLPLSRIVELKVVQNLFNHKSDHRKSIALIGLLSIKKNGRQLDSS